MRKLTFILCAVFMLAAGTVFAGGRGQAGGAAQEKFPTRPIRFILPVSPGGGMDTSARQWQKHFEKELGVPMIFESQAGAGTLIGNRAVAQAEPDGYTLGMFSSPDFDFTVLTMDAPYTADDFYWIGGFYNDASMLWVHKDSPWNNMRDFIDYVKTQPPGTVALSSTTQTSVTFVMAKNLEKAGGVQLNIVSFPGGNPARLAVASKEVAATITGLFNGQMIADSCKIIGCVDNANPLPERTNNAKTIYEEFGVDVKNPYSFYGIYAPAGLKEKYPDRADFITKAFERTINGEGYLNDLKTLNMEYIHSYKGPEDSKKQIDLNLQILEEYKPYFE